VSSRREPSTRQAIGRDPEPAAPRGSRTTGGTSLRSSTSESRPPGDESGARNRRASFDALDEDFFAREAELHRDEPADSFEDLGADEPPPPRAAPSAGRRGWLGFGKPDPPPRRKK
jgi:hypothetical protein